MAENNIPLPASFNNEHNGNVYKQNLQSFLQGPGEQQQAVVNNPNQPVVNPNQQEAIEQVNKVLDDNQIQQAIFFDNDHTNIVLVYKACGNIISCVEIPESSSAGPTLNYGTPYMDHLRNRLKDKQYFDFLASIQRFDTLDIVSGIQSRHLAQLQEWMENTATFPRRAAIFDWDRTLTMFEGFSLESYEGLKWGSILRYLMGGDKRFNGLRRMFQMLHEQNIQIIILTNNGACGSPDEEMYRLFFQGLVEAFLDPIPFTLICSRYTARGHKGNAIRQDPRFTGCVAQALSKGGKRKTKGKGKRKSKRKTRKY